MKLKEKFRAISLRNQGLSYSQIRKIIKVSKSSLTTWLSDIKLTKIQQDKLLVGLEKSRYTAGQIKKENKILKIKNLLNEGRKEFPILYQNSLFLAGLVLYLAEGDKHKAERVKFTNSDPALICLMMRWFREICKVPETKFRIALHIHNLQVNDSLINYWSKLLGIPKGQFQKIYIKKSSLRQRRNILYNGTCGIVVSNKDLFRKIMGWRAGLLNHFNISS